MKTYIKIPMLVAMAVLLTAGSAMALSFTDVVGLVNPFSANIKDNGDGTSTITELEYEFLVADAVNGAEMNWVELSFEKDIFLSVEDPYNYDPTDWSYFKTNDEIWSWAGSTLGVGESLSFMVDVLVLTAALTDDSMWDEGQVWSQAWNSMDTGIQMIIPTTGQIVYGGDGGSTAPVPEPATMLLMGTGLAGLVAVVRRRKFKKS